MGAVVKPTSVGPPIKSSPSMPRAQQSNASERRAAVERPTISVVVPARDAADVLPRCLAGLQRQIIPRNRYEVIVVDDGSSDLTARVAAEAGVRVIGQNWAGPAAARNRGAREARADLLVFTDADCVAAPDFLEKIVSPLGDPSVVGVKGAYRTQQRGVIPRFVQAEYEHKYVRTRRFPRIDFVDTYAAAYRRDVFLAHGGFLVSFPHPSVEDQELSFRLAGLGHKLLFAPQAIVYHCHDETIGDYVRRKFRIGYWKAKLLRWHPARLLNDSHTPLAQRLQVALFPLCALAALLAALQGTLSLAFAAGGLGLLLTCPELATIVQFDWRLLFIAPLMLFLRAASLAAGLMAGALTRSKDPPTADWVSLRPWQFFVKRALDICLASLAGLPALPIVMLAALAIKLESPGPAFFAQMRAGKAGKPFRLYKLRTMVSDAEDKLAAVRHLSPLSGVAFKIQDDPRVTRAGRFLRRWSIDELPQLWNVLRGEMSLVGPRPEELGVVARYSEWHRKRLVVLPGLTGPMQISGRGLLSLDQRVHLEVEYIEQYSLWRDVRILLLTPQAVLHGEGAL
jgi:lipopolysaccharide/colanic/teichoic acid biosynthesis glycosyltransferase/GT2 family glycosyltransferase